MRVTDVADGIPRDVVVAPQGSLTVSLWYEPSPDVVYLQQAREPPILVGTPQAAVFAEPMQAAHAPPPVHAKPYSPDLPPAYEYSPEYSCEAVVREE